MYLYLAIAAVGFLVGMYIMKDASELEIRVNIAEELMKRGMAEPDAMEESGCNFWDMPWYKRIFMSYPENHQQQ